MKFRAALLATLALFAGHALAELQVPTLTLKSTGRPLELVELSVEVTLTGNLAETVLDLTYLNNGNRNEEGEFALQLPEGAAVSTYALEVNGEMRPAVSVEKEQARFAYESIKARQIDPGLVEKMADNIYRTRIFPIPRNGEKRVSIGFIHIIKNGDYTFPFKIDEKLRQFSCTVSGTLAEPPDFDPKARNAAFEPTDVGWSFTQEDSLIASKLVCRSEIPETGNVLTRHQYDTNGNLYFFSQGPVEGNLPTIAPEHWKEFRLIWDVSLSGGWRQHEAEFAALRRIVEFAKKAKVEVCFLGEELGQGKIIDVRDGDAGPLIGHLKTAVYGGIADFSKLVPNGKKTLIVTDGRIASPRWMPPKNWDDSEVHWLFSGSGPGSAGLREFATSLVEIGRQNWWDEFVRASSVRIEPRAEGVRLQVELQGKNFLVTGMIPATHVRRTKVQIGQKHSIRFPAQTRTDPSEEWNFCRRVWATSRLRELEATGDTNAITDFAKVERLTSDYTSLIVLERFSDHLTYDIPPPEPDLLAKFRLTKANRESSKGAIAKEVWKSKSQWYAKGPHYPWFDDELQAEVRTVGIWVDASREAFPDAKRNEKPLRQYEKWMTEAKKTLRKRDDVDRYAEFSQWIKALSKHAEELDTIREKTPTATQDREIHVSLRGSLREIGIFTGDTKMTLSDLIREAGGPHHPRDLARVFLYRNARRTGYNLLSDDYQPTPLKWGDMVVVEDSWSTQYLSRTGFADPFSAPVDGFPTRESPSPAEAPAVFEQTGSVRAPTLRTPTQPAQSNSSRPETAASSKITIPVNKALGEEFFTDLQGSEKPLAAYREMLAKRDARTSLHGRELVRVAAVFFAKNEKTAAKSVLRNLFEVIADPFEANRTYAYWLHHFGETGEALAALTEASHLPGLDGPMRALLHFDRGLFSGDSAPFGESLEEILGSARHAEFANIALTEYYRRDGEKLFHFQKRILDSDSRVVVVGLNGSFELSVGSPDSYAGMVNESARTVQSLGVAEHQTLNAFPGVTKPRIVKASPGTYHIVLYQNFGKENETKTVDTIWLGGTKTYELGELDFRWEDFDEAKHKQRAFEDRSGDGQGAVDPFR